MGKALLIIVLGAGIVLARQLYSTTEAEQKTGEHQLEYQEQVIAREIAASAFNVAMGEIRSFGDDVHGGAQAFNAGGSQSGTYSSGRFAGGSFETHAEMTSGHGVRVVATGRFGDAEFTMHDEYRIPVLYASDPGIVIVEPPSTPTTPDVCSAMFYQYHPVGETAPTTPEMIYASSDQSRHGKQAIQSMYAPVAAQMNFFIAIDADCSMKVDVSADDCADEDFAASYTFNAADWDAIYYALDIDPSKVDQAEEGDHAFVEQDATNRQSWRISWEDQNSWTSASDASKALSALKGGGYDGSGWTLSGTANYVSILDKGTSAPDYADQSVVVTLIKSDASNFKGKQKSVLAKQKKCDQPLDQPLDGTQYDVDNDGEVDIPAAPAPTPSPEPEPEDTAVDKPLTADDLTSFACDCTSNGTKSNKRAILHYPPGNQANVQLICIGLPAVDDHLVHHRDAFPTCQVGQAIKNNNAKKK